MSGETESQVSSWTVDSLRIHQLEIAALRLQVFEEKIARVNDRLNAEQRFGAERDRRYTEVKNAEEKALKIKEEADKTALGLQRETQTYKDEKANELREQIGNERGLYVTKAEVSAIAEKNHSEIQALGSKIEAQLAPVLSFVSAQQGNVSGRVDQQRLVQWLVYLLLAGLVVFSYIRK